MRCFECKKTEAEWVLIHDVSDQVLPLCQTCMDEWCHMEGEVNLDFFHLEMDLFNFFNQINEILKFRTRNHLHLLQEYTELKNQSSKPKANENNGI